MKSRKSYSNSIRLFVKCTLILFLGCQVWVAAKTVDWQGPAGSKIKRIRYFPKETQPEESTAAPLKSTAPSAAPTTFSNVIDSPPVDGFIPWIVLTATNESIDAETTGIYETFPSDYTGNPPSGTDPRTDYFIGIFDTGASANVIGYENAVQAGLYNSTYLTSYFIEVSGVTGSVQAHVTQPYALFMDGLDALEPNMPGESEMVLPTTSGLVGEYNVATLIGQDPGSNPDLATAIGTPMSVFYDTHIEVDQPITVTHNGIEYAAPKITFYGKDSTQPSYPNYVPLELKPLGAVNVQYITYGFNPEDLLDLFSSLNFELDYSPLTPSVVMGTASQSLFFIHGVDLTEGSRDAQDKNRFMLDTGAQITVVGNRIAARLGLNPNNKDFEVDIEGVTGEVIQAPGFYIDSLKIPGMGQWLEFTNVPVVLLEVSSPEGGKLDGIIGMNLFTQYNLILRAGGLSFEDDPRLEFERIQIGPVTGDIAPDPVDGKVNLADFSAFSQTWMATDTDGNWNPDADFVPTGTSEGVIDLEDLSVLSEHWLSGAF
jgi:predicted aspartyl protease